VKVVIKWTLKILSVKSLMLLKMGKNLVIKNVVFQKKSSGSVLDMIRNERYATGIVVQRGGIGNPVRVCSIGSAKIEMKGVEYLEKNCHQK
jgi:hypothetical protein